MADMTVTQALSAVMQDVQAIGKNDRNQSQNFSFRGVDAVINAVGPVLRKHGVVIIPASDTYTESEYETGKGTRMHQVIVKINWNIYGPAGDSIQGSSFGQASDTADKAIPKAHSVAYRTMLLEALCIPTDEPDPDAVTEERAPRLNLDREVARVAAHFPTKPEAAAAAREKGYDLRSAADMKRYADELDGAS